MTVQLPSSSAIETAVPGLAASAPGSLPFAPDHHIRAFLLRREMGNVLIYASPAIRDSLPAFSKVGGVTREYLGHQHESTFGAGASGAPVFLHRADRDAVAAHIHVRGTFTRRHALDDDLEVIPMPGHTPGSTAYLWSTGAHRVLFTADTISLDDGDWRAAVLDSSDREQYLESLELLRDLDFDVLVPWVARRDEPFLAFTDEADRRARIDAIIDRIWRGENR